VSAALYDAAIVATAKETAKAERLPAPDVTVEEDNPLCGDRITLDLAFADGRVAAIGHKTRGCLLTRAAAVVLARHAVGADPAELRRAIASLRALLAGQEGAPAWPELSMFEPVRAVPSRHDCVLLPFRALETALDRRERERPA
jgi:NifU-like protein involved in Fe-S cluster formation